MKLSAKEVKLISDLSTKRKRRVWGAWVSFLTVVALLVATYGYGMFPALGEGPFLGFAVGAAFVNLVHVYFGVRPEDKLIDLLQRYVNQDPEAIAQIAGVTESEGAAA